MNKSIEEKIHKAEGLSKVAQSFFSQENRVKIQMGFGSIYDQENKILNLGCHHFEGKALVRVLVHEISHIIECLDNELFKNHFGMAFVEAKPDTDPEKLKSVLREFTIFGIESQIYHSLGLNYFKNKSLKGAFNQTQLSGLLDCIPGKSPALKYKSLLKMFHKAKKEYSFNRILNEWNRKMGLLNQAASGKEIKTNHWTKEIYFAGSELNNPSSWSLKDYSPTELAA